MFHYLPKNISIVENERSGIELDDISTRLILDLSLSEAKTVFELFSASGVVAIHAALANPDLHIEEFVTNVQDSETVSANLNKNNIISGAVFPITRFDELHQKADVVIVRTVLEKRKQLIIKSVISAAAFLQEGGVIYLVGAKDEGVQSIAKELSKLLNAEQETLSYKQGVHLIKITPSANRTPLSLMDLPLNYQDIELRNIKLRLILDESVFAKGGLDPATKLLAENMVIADNERVLDLGCGSGVLGMVARQLARNVEVVMVDNDYATVQLCKKNVELNNLTDCRVLASDGTKAVRDEKFDVIVTNPPFHQGRQISYSAAEQFVFESRNSLLPGGKLFVVSNIFLPYEEIVQGIFGKTMTVAENKSYKIISAIRR